MTTKNDQNILIIRYNASINNSNISDLTKMYSRKITNRYDDERYYIGLDVYIIGSGSKYSGVLLARGILNNIPIKKYPIEINRFLDNKKIEWDKKCWEFNINITSRDNINIKNNNIYVNWNRIKNIVSPTLI
jgi:hypothetical protein